MPTNRRYRSSGRRSGSKPVTSWFNDSVLIQSLGPTSQVVFDLTPATQLPEGFLSGFTILRFLLTVVGAPTAVLQTASLIWGAYVYGRAAIGSPPDLVLDNMDYYVRDELQVPSDPVNTPLIQKQVDIRTARRIRGEDRSVHIQMRNIGSTAAIFGLSWRMLLKKS